MSNANSPIALIVPTVHHRASLFDRTLRFLEECGCPAPIIVSDHSPANVSNVIAGVARQYGKLDVRLLKHEPDMHFLKRLAACAAVADTPYVHLHADDDFLAPSAVGPLIQVMEEDPGCVAVMGLNVHLSNPPKVSAKGEIDQAAPFARLIAQLEGYSSVLYALRRTDEFISSLTFAADRCPDVQFWQYLESCVAVLRGKIRVIDELHYVRSVHPGKWSSTLIRERSRDHFPYLMLEPAFHPRFTAFRAALIEACEVAGAVVEKDVLDAALIHLLSHGFGAMGLPKARFGRDVLKARSKIHEQAFLKQAGDPAGAVGMVLGHILRCLQKQTDGTGDEQP